MESPSQFKQKIKELNQRYFLIIDEVVKTYPNYKIKENNDMLQDSYKKNLGNLQKLQAEFFLFKNNINKNTETLNDDIKQIDEKIYETLISFIKNKNNKDDIFDLITPINLNNYIQEFMPDLTAKTFRTMRANEIFQEEIDKINENYKNYNKDDIKEVLLDAYIKANIKVALSCNHQKKISKSFAEQINKLSENINKLNEKKKNTTNKDKIHKLNEKIKKLKNKRELKSQIKNLSITTSKVNYIDPRISIAFIKKHNLNIDKVLTKNLQEKFNWAIDVDKDWIF